MKNVVQIIFMSGSKFLLGFRQNTEAFDQYWGFPSGRIEQGELPRSAAEREAREEVAVDAGNLTLFAIVSDPELPFVIISTYAMNGLATYRMQSPIYAKSCVGLTVMSYPKIAHQ